MRSRWDAEIADDKENGKEDGRDLVPHHPIDPEDEAEAFENYLFDGMATYDADAACQLIHFRSSRSEDRS
jgi:hypothetical protein